MIHPINEFVIKVASRCNLDCDYCYEYHTGDDTWKMMPKYLSLDTAKILINRINEHARKHYLDEVVLSFHGGEPLLFGPERLYELAKIFRSIEDDDLEVSLTMQTNGTLLNNKFIKIIKEMEIFIAISIDGPEYVNDIHRLDHNGRSTFGNTLTGLNLIKESLTLEKGLILFTPHLGNIEILIKYLTQEFKCSIPYTKVKNNALENLIYSARKDMGANMVEANLSGVKSLLKSIKNKEVVAIASDQVPDVKGGYVTKFFNSDSLTMTLVTNLVIKTNSPCHSMICLRGHKGSHFKISFSRIVQGLNINLPLGANSMNRELEKCIMLAPEQYAWEYKKYKHASNENPYLY